MPYDRSVGKAKSAQECNRGAFTVIELLTSVVILGMLVALLLTAVQAARESARRTECGSNLRQLGVAISAYTSVHGHFPPGSFRMGQGGAFSAHTSLLPHVDREALYREIDFSGDARSGVAPHPTNDAARGTIVPLFLCPTDAASVNYTFGTGETIAATSYAGNYGSGMQKYGYNGIFVHVRPKGGAGPVAPAEVADGLAYTVAMSEILMANGTREFLRVNWYTENTFAAPQELETFATYCESHEASNVVSGDLWGRGRPWTFGDAGRTLYNHILTPNRVSCTNGRRWQEGAYTAASLHREGVNVVFADARVLFVRQTVSRDVWRSYGSRSEREVMHRFD